MTSVVATGQPAPDFTLVDHLGQPFTLSEQRGRAVVLFFYPKANSTGCTIEACAFRDAYEDFTDAGAIVVGVSQDGQAAISDFVGRQSLPFTLLSDPGNQVGALYRLKNRVFFLRPRITFLIDAAGTIRQVYDQSFNIAGHAAHMLKAVTALQSPTPAT